MTTNRPAARLYQVLMSERGTVAHLEDEATGGPMCGRPIARGHHLADHDRNGLAYAACRGCVETERATR